MLKKILKKLENKKLLVVLVLLLLTVNIFVIINTFSEKTSSTIWDGSIANNFKNGDGTLDNPYIISNGSELAYFFKCINGENNLDYFNKYFQLENNIDLDGKDFSFAKFGKTFSGSLNGNGYTISNFKISNYYLSDDKTSAYFSLFDSLDSAYIKNLNLSDINLYGGSDIEVEKIDKIESETEENAEEISENINVEDTTSDIGTFNVESLVEENPIDEENEQTENAIDENDKESSEIVEKNVDEELDNTEEIIPSENIDDDSNEQTENTTLDNENNSNEQEKIEDEILVPDVNEENDEIENNTHDEENTDIEIEDIDEKIYVNNIYIGLFSSAKSTSFDNINIYNIEIKNENDSIETDSSLFLVNDESNNTLTNIHINGKSSINNTSILINKYDNSEIERILYSDSLSVLVNGYEGDTETLLKYSDKDSVKFNNNYAIKSIVEMLNNNSEFNWVFSNNKFRIQNNGVEETRPRPLLKMARPAPSAHDSGIDGNVVYVNDYEADANYYDGLKYTYNTDNTLPTLTEKSVYSDNTLVHVESHYYGSDITGTYTGTVSINETQNEFVYYKLLEINNNGTASNLNDDYVIIDLIDNPFSRRPNNRVFNGWTSDYRDTNGNTAFIYLDKEIYTRKAKVPVIYNNSVPASININFYSVWGVAHNVTNLGATTTWANAFNNLEASGYHVISETVNTYENCSNYYYYGGSVANNGRYAAGTYQANGTYNSDGNTRCRQTSCPYYYRSDANYVSDREYYRLRNNSMQRYYPTLISSTYNTDVPVDDSSAGYYRKTVILRYGSQAGYYNNNGDLLSGTCNTSGGCEVYELIQYYDNDGNPEVVHEGDELYYYTTRDTNIIVLTGNRTGNNYVGSWGTGQNKPFTLTAINNGTSYINSTYWNLGNNTINCYADTRIENIRINSSALQNNGNAPTNNGAFIGNFYNTKLGRGITRYNNNNTTMTVADGGGNTAVGSSSSVKRFIAYVESGFYNNAAGVANANDSKTYYLDGKIVYGNDYDRVNNDNSKLNVRYSYSTFWNGVIYGATTRTVAVTTYVKSGQIGSNKYDYAAGLYVGGRNSSSASRHSPMSFVMEGGYIYNLIGGPLSLDANKAYNDIYMYMKGGEVQVVIGGAGASATTGNRIIQITGGKVNYSVFGGSNGVTADGRSYTATLDGSTYIVIGGNAVIGDETAVTNGTLETISKCEAGSVFGIGNGNSSSNTIGTANNSNIIILEGATILNNVYGGGNYAAAGQTGTRQTYATNIVIHGGTISGSVYGGGNNNGSGSTSNTDNIAITMDGGDIGGSIYGGSRTKGTVYGSSTLNITKGTIHNDVYGGGEGGYRNTNNPGTFVSGNVDITIGNNTSGPTINGNVYGGSAFGTVNATSTNPNVDSSKHVNVTVNKGNVIGSVFGGAKGGTSNGVNYTPYIAGNITVDINGGTITEVFGGFDEAGKPKGTDYVYLDGGTITNAYGGGNKTSIDETNIYLRGATVGTLYGGSNQNGDVIDTNVSIESGEVDLVFGGNNIGGTCETSNINITGSTINDAIYGGGNEVNTTTTNVDIYNISNTVPLVFGGGNEVDSSEQSGDEVTNVTLHQRSGDNNISIEALYGGCNQAGNVNVTNVIVETGEITTLYGGNNQGGVSSTTNINVSDGEVTTLFGGGNIAESGESFVTLNGGEFENVYGGGDNAEMSDDTNIVMNNGTISGTLFGGGNNGDVVGSTSVIIVDGSMNQLYGGGNDAEVGGDTNVRIMDGTVTTNVFGGGNNGDVTGNTKITVIDGSMNAIYGGGNNANVGGNTRVNIYGGEIATDVYGGGNLGQITGNTVVRISDGSINSLYGGGKGSTATVGGNTDVDIIGGTISTVIYGGGNAGSVTGTTDVYIANIENTVPNVYGGGNEAGASDTNVTLGSEIPSDFYTEGGSSEPDEPDEPEEPEPVIVQEEHWVKVTSLSNITTTDRYLITNQDNTYSLGFNGNALARGAVTLTEKSTADDGIYYDITGDGSGNNNQWKFGTAGTGGVIQNYGDQTKYMRITTYQYAQVIGTQANATTDNTIQQNGNYWRIGRPSTNGGNYNITYYNNNFVIRSNDTTGASLNIYVLKPVNVIKDPSTEPQTEIVLVPEEHWIRVTALSDITTTDRYLFTNESNDYSVGYSGTALARGAVTVTEKDTGTGSKYYEITGDGSVTNNQWKFGTAGTGGLVQNYGDQTKYMKISSYTGTQVIGDLNNATTNNEVVLAEDGYWYIGRASGYSGYYYITYYNNNFVIRNNDTNGALLNIYKWGTVDVAYEREIEDPGGGDTPSEPEIPTYDDPIITEIENNINITNLYGGSNQSGNINTSTILMELGTVTNLYGGNNAGGETSDTSITINDGSVTTLYGGGNNASGENTSVVITDGTFGNVYGGGKGSAALIDEDTNIIISGGEFTGNIYGGGNQGIVTGTATINISNHEGTISNVYGGGNQAGVGSTVVNINDVDDSSVVITNLYGGSNQSGAVTNTELNVHTGTIAAIYGGNNQGGSTTTNVINVDGGTIGDIFGGGNRAVTTDTIITIDNGTINNSIYGGGNAAQALGNTILTINDGEVGRNIYGGGNQGVVKGNTRVIIANGEIGGSAYAGGNGATATVEGNTYILVGGNSVIGTDECDVLSACSVFGGGNAAKTGVESKNNSIAEVQIVGGTIYGNVYGGANTSKVFGETDVNIGADVEQDESVLDGNIHIYGTVFGGGEANASGSDDYDWTFVSVTNAISVNINGENYSVFQIDGSIFGSGNASTTTGTSEINIKNYGTFEEPARNISIQRTDILTIDNSNIVLKGATDRTNDYSDVLFTLSIIDELDLTNNSTLFLETGANLLKEFKSLTSTGALAEVTIDENSKTVTKNVDNRIYMLAGKNLNIAKNSNVTDYGEVSGMTFLGMYKYNGDESVNVGIYDKFDYGDTLDWGDVLNDGSYVLGLHKTNHDIEVDGFYTNYIDENTAENIVNYIDPIPPSGAMYMWVVGESVIEYEFELSASKYSTLGTYELSLRDFTKPNTTFEILGFDYSGLASGVQLVEKNTIPRIAATGDDADTLMGLTMETSNSGWLVNGSTYFLSNDTEGPVVGTQNYIGGNNTLVPTLLFCLHHAKNITTAGSMGVVSIQLLAITQIDDLTKESERLIITIDLNRALYNTNDYEAAMTAGRKYSLFTSTATNITASSSISAYYSLFGVGESIYKTGYHRALVSNYVLPLNTKITMIDLSGDNPEYYYLVIDSDDVSAATAEFNIEGDVAYPLSMFEIMGAQNSGVYYDDVQKNIDYYDGTYSDEEFIFIVDFDDTNITSDSLNNSLKIEMLNADDETIISVLGVQQESLIYNIYAEEDAIIDIDGELSTNKIYAGEDVTVHADITYTQTQVGSVTIYDTHYFDSKLGVKISLIDSNGNIVTGTSLLGLYYTINNVNYYPNLDGTTRIKIADRVDTAETWIKVNTGTSSIPTDNYKLRIESFGSADGIYYGLNSSDHVDLDLEIINEIYGLDIQIAPEEMIINHETGLNTLGLDEMTYTFFYNSGLENPSIHVKMYRRNYDEMYDTDYTLVDAKDYFKNAFTDGNAPKEYTLLTNPSAEATYMFVPKEDLVTGTYKMEFILYSNNSAIGNVIKYFIIK